MANSNFDVCCKKSNSIPDDDSLALALRCLRLYSALQTLLAS